MKPNSLHITSVFSLLNVCVINDKISSEPLPQIILFLSILNFLLIESFNKVESPSGYKCACSSVFFAEEKIFFWYYKWRLI